MRFPQAKKGIPIEHTEQVEHHRWTPPGPYSRGLAPLDGPTRALLHQLRWRKAPPNRGRRWLVLGIVLVLHVLFGWLTWHEMQLRKASEMVREDRAGALQVRLIPRAFSSQGPVAPPELVPPPPPEPAPPPPPVSRPVVHEPPAKNAMTVSLPPEPPAPATSSPPSTQPPIGNATGEAALPTKATTVAPPAEPGYVDRTPQGDTSIMQHTTTVPYKATRFEKDWQKGGGSSVDDALQKAVDKSTVEHTFHVAPGVRIHCSLSLAMLGGGCGGDPPPPPSYKNRDMRLNMAPASQLAPGSPEPAKPSVEECIAIYRADKPLPYGCPVDTPTRAVDAEIQERAAHPASQDGH
ncbi:hypothetical protein [Dyella sp. C11]|uniref:hypothetical protein n=1 Tax=Dyella sp. C11 TaxID=2126991 RepID=UPI001E295A4C|nr:hypothetical protein [Dyella sp. C11]